MNSGSEKRSENLTYELQLSVRFTQSFETVDNIGESRIHVSDGFRFIHLEYFILGDEKIYLGLFHPESPFICNFQLILNFFSSGAHTDSIKFISG